MKFLGLAFLGLALLALTSWLATGCAGAGESLADRLVPPAIGIAVLVGIVAGTIAGLGRR